MAEFLKLIEPLPKPLRVLDVGGTETFWRSFGLLDNPDFQITLLNPEDVRTDASNLVACRGDGRSMPEYQDKKFDIVFSNSVLEHVGSIEHQTAMAREIRRVGKRFYIQTPNRYFPIEPHFLFPFFQFLPRICRIKLVQGFALGWQKKETDRKKAEALIDSIHLLRKKDIQALFPGAFIKEERFMGLVKSFVAYDGFQS